MSENEKNPPIKSVSRALVLLGKLFKSNSPLGVNDIARQCDMNLSTAFRILKTLTNDGWIYQCEDDRYIIAPRFSFVTERKNFYFALKEISSFTMNRIAAEESQAMNLVVRKGDKCIILQQSRTKKLIDLIPPINTILPIHASASGKVIMAGLPDSLLNLFIGSNSFERYTNNTITDPKIFASSIEKVRKNGYALDCHESLDNAFCISVPILNDDKETIAALSFSGIISAYDESLINYYLPILRSAANEISNNVFNVYHQENL